MVFQNDILAGSSGASGASSVYQIDQSIRFNPADSTYMSRAVGSGGNTKTWTFSCWFKIGVLGSKRSVSPFLWSCHQSDANRLQLSFDSCKRGRNLRVVFYQKQDARSLCRRHFRQNHALCRCDSWTLLRLPE